MGNTPFIHSKYELTFTKKKNLDTTKKLPLKANSVGVCPTIHRMIGHFEFGLTPAGVIRKA
jgi:hypothetical protein